MQLIIQARMDVAPPGDRAWPAAAPDDIVRVADELRVVLRPLHPGTQDRRLASYFSVEVPDQASAERLLAELEKSDAIQAAYIKPPDAMA